jgi:enoyl-CoA hydratase/carnithine racemase
VAARNAIFVMAYSNVALSPDGGGSWQLARALPRQLASELLLGGERIGAERLHQLGVVGRVRGRPGAGHEPGLPPSWARAPNALASIKELVQDAGGRSLHEHLAAEREHFVRNLHHPNGGIGIAAFLGKHPARYE